MHDELHRYISIYTVIYQLSFLFFHLNIPNYSF